MENSTPANEPITEERISYLMKQMDMKLDNYHLSIGLMKTRTGPKESNIYGSVLTKTARAFPLNIPADDIPSAINKLITYIENL